MIIDTIMTLLEDTNKIKDEKSAIYIDLRMIFIRTLVLDDYSVVLKALIR